MSANPEIIISDFDASFRTNGELSNTSLCSVLEALLPEQQGIIWDGVEKQLERLDANTPGHHSLLPEDKILVFKQSGEMSLTSQAKSLGLSGKNRKGVKGAMRDVRTALSWIRDDSVYSLSELIPQFLLNSEEKRRYERLEDLHAESDQIRRIREDPKAQKLLKRIPHVDKLLEAFEEASTVRKLLIELGIPCQNPPISACNRAVRQFIRYNKLDGIRALADRVLLANWLKSESDFKGRDADVIIPRTAVFLFSQPLPEESSESFINLVRYMRLFLREILYIEFEKAIKDSRFVATSDFSELFPRNDGQRADSFCEVDVGKSYRLYVRYHSYPEYLKEFAREIVRAEKTYLEIAKDMQSYPQYSRKSKRSIAWAGKVFLRSVLLTNNTSIHWHTLIDWHTFKKRDLDSIKAVGDLIQDKF